MGENQMDTLKYGFATLVLVLSACGQSDNEEIYNENNTNVIGGVVYDTEEKPINGIYKTYYTTGAIKMEMAAKNGLPNGEGKFYDENGNIQFSGTFGNGKINGKFYQYYEDGTIHNELNYVNGVRNENQILYDEKGQILAEIVYNNDKAINGYVLIDDEKIPLEADDLKDLSLNALPEPPEALSEEDNENKEDNKEEQEIEPEK